MKFVYTPIAKVVVTHMSGEENEIHNDPINLAFVETLRKFDYTPTPNSNRYPAIKFQLSRREEMWVFNNERVRDVTYRRLVSATKAEEIKFDDQDLRGK